MRNVRWLGVVRHGESVGNQAAQRAETSGADRLDIDTPDAATPLSATGRDQARALGLWILDIRPDVVISSTYRRAVETATVALPDTPIRTDERLRDRELGILDRLTSHGVRNLFPQEAARRRFQGTFYYRPPGGESWADCALRVRSVLGDVDSRYQEKKVLLVAHEAIIMILRYVVEELSVDRLMELSRSPLFNAGLTSWRRAGDTLVPERYDQPTTDAPTTRQDDV